jgi:hypothetical protein
MVVGHGRCVGDFARRNKRWLAMLCKVHNPMKKLVISFFTNPVHCEHN